MSKECLKTGATFLQGLISVGSFASGVIIACVCLFIVPPYGEITNSAISIVSELLCLCGALLGAKVHYDTKMSNFRAEIESKLKQGEAKDNDNE